MKTHFIEVRRTFKYRMYQNKKSEKYLFQTINIAGIIWNHCVALQRRYYRLTGKYISSTKLQAHLANLRMKRKRFAYWQQVGSQAVQEIAQRLDAAYQRFFKKEAGRPRFKKVKKFKSFVLKQAGWELLGEKNARYDSKGRLKHAMGLINIQGHVYKFIKHREIQGTIKTVTIKRDSLDRLWICFSVKEAMEVPKEASTGQSGGFGFGLKTFLTDEQGRAYASPQFLRKELRTLRKLNQCLSRKKEGSHNRKRAKCALARAHIRIADKREDHHFQLAHDICDLYQAVIFEDLSLSGMKALWGRKVSDLGFGQFVEIMKWIAIKRGVIFGQCDRFARTTQRCCACKRNQTVTLSERVFRCRYEDCGLIIDRDHNAALNILYAGASALGLEIVRLPSGAVLFEAGSRRL